MGIYFEDVIWQIDRYLLFLEILTVISIFALITFYEIRKRMVSYQVKRLHQRMKTCSIDDDSCFAEETLPVLKHIGIETFVSMLQNKENIQDEKLLGRIRQNLLRTKEVAVIERTAVKGRNKWKRIEAILALSYINPDYVLKVVKKTIYDKDDDVVFFSLEALRNIRTKESAAIILEGIKKGIYSGYKAASILESFPVSIAEIFVRELDVDDENLKSWCIRILAHLRAKQYIVEVAGCVENKYANVRAAVCEYFGMVKAIEHQQLLRQRLKDKVWFVRLKALQSLDRILGEKCVDIIASFIRDKSSSVVEAVKHIMIKYPYESLKFAKEYLYDKDMNIHNIGLEIIDASKYTDKIIEGVFSSEEIEREESLQMLETMLKTGVEIGLEPALRDSSEYIRPNLIDFIASLDSRKAKNIKELLDKRKI